MKIIFTAMLFAALILSMFIMWAAEMTGNDSKFYHAAAWAILCAIGLCLARDREAQD